MDPVRKPQEEPVPTVAPIARAKPAPQAPAPTSTPISAGAGAAHEGAGAGSGGGRTLPFKIDRLRILIALALAVVLGALIWGWNYWTVGRFLVSTDNAYVGADMSIVAPRVAGYVAEVPVRANQRVATGAVLVQIDDGDFRIAVQQAEARLATQDATIARLGEQIGAGVAAVTQSRAGLTAAQADAARAAADFERTQTLATTHIASPAALDAARAMRDRSIAAVDQARAGIAVAEANLAVLRAQKAEAESARKELEAVLAKAQRDLAATVIRAPFDGVIGNKAVESGDYVAPGKRLMAIIPLDGVYIDANFKETQLASIRPGQSVKLVLDADPGRPIEGIVESLSPAAGALFSLLPPENATGNFTKIVQRVPVRIRVKTSSEQLLLPGLSVYVTVDTRPASP